MSTQFFMFDKFFTKSEQKIFIIPIDQSYEDKENKTIDYNELNNLQYYTSEKYCEDYEPSLKEEQSTNIKEFSSDINKESKKTDTYKKEKIRKIYLSQIFNFTSNENQILRQNINQIKMQLINKYMNEISKIH
ncbi:MAG: hypothetical protein MJ252_01720 [archaeon]|nr:hypothetical protein [archaeon]